MTKNHYEVIVVGGGISGGAVFYELGKYTDVQSIALLEKYDSLASLNTKGTSNSQTIHCGDIETNYTVEKAAKVKKTARMIVNYCLSHNLQDKLMFSHQKMALGVGEEEVAFMEKRFEDFRELYPYLEVYDKDALKQIEPKLVYDLNGNERKDKIIGVGVKDEYTTVDFGAMTEHLVATTLKIENKKTDVFLNSEVESISKIGDTHYIQTKNGKQFTADFVIVNAGAHSLYLAHKMGYGLNYGCLPVAGSFYLTTKKILNGKVYMVQNDKLPFAALHGDPDILANGFTRFGPTALVLPKLERYHGNKTVKDFFQTLRFDKSIAKIFKDLMSDSTIRNYVLRNFVFEVPYLGKQMFLKDARKIVPSLVSSDIQYAKGFGGVRPQVLDREQKKLMLGEASVNPGTGILFNMTPSPGATSCLGNAWRDVKIVTAFINKTYDKDKFTEELDKE